MDELRNLPLRGANNIRDLSVVSSLIRPGKLLRGDHLHALTERDVHLLTASYNLTNIVDLRTTQERDEKPDVDIPGVRSFHLPIFDESTAGITRESDSSAASLSDRIPDMTELYQTMVSPSCRKSLSAVLSKIISLAQKPGAVLYHCTAGKDRTGIVSFLLLSLMGVPEKIILDDYLFTNLSAEKQAKKYYWLIRLFKRDRKAAEQLYRVFTAEEAYLTGAKSKILDTSPDILTFVSAFLEIPPSEIDAFRNAVLL